MCTPRNQPFLPAFVWRSSSTGMELGGRPKTEFIAIAEMASPFVRDVLKLKFISGSQGHLIMNFDARDSFIGHPKTKVLHGGVVAAALDHVAGFSAWTTLNDKMTMISTVDLRVDYLKPCPFEAELQVVGRVISIMKRTIRVDVELRTKEKSLIAVGRGSFNAYSPRILIDSVSGEDN